MTAAAIAKWEGSLKEALQDELRPNPTRHARVQNQNITALHEGTLFVWDEPGNCVTAIGLRGNGLGGVRSQALMCDRPIEESIHSLVVNNMGTRLALVGRNTLIVIILPDNHGPQGSYNNGAEDVACMTKLVGQYYNMADIIQVRFHPYSSNHISVLTADGCLRIYDLSQQNTELPEIELSVSSGSSRANNESAVGFDYGGPVGWNRFCIYVLLQSGDVMYWTPVLPRNSVIPTEDFESLVESAHPTQKQWLVEASRYSSSNSDGYITLSNPNAWSKPIRQGPFKMFPTPTTKSWDGAAISVLPSTPTAMILADHEGQLFVCLTLQSVEGKWDMSSDDNDEEQLLFVLENIQLGFKCPQISLYPDPLHGSRIYAFHSRGVHGVWIPWLESIKEYCETSKSLVVPDVSRNPSTVIDLVSTVPLTDELDENSSEAPILGVSVVTEPSLGYALIAISCEFQVVVVPLVLRDLRLEAPTNLPQLDKSHSPAKVLKDGGFQKQIDKILDEGTSLPTLSAPSKDGINLVDCQYELESQIAAMRENFMIPITKAREAVKNRLSVQEELKKVQSAQLGSLQEKLSEISKKQSDLAATHDRLRTEGDILLSRLQLTVTQLDASLPVLSDAEMQYRNDLEDIYKVAVSSERKCGELVRKQEKFRQLYGGQVPQGYQRSTVSHNKLNLYKESLQVAQENIDNLMTQVQDIEVRLPVV